MGSITGVVLVVLCLGFLEMQKVLGWEKGGVRSTQKSCKGRGKKIRVVRLQADESKDLHNWVGGGKEKKKKREGKRTSIKFLEKVSSGQK